MTGTAFHRVAAMFVLVASLAACDDDPTGPPAPPTGPDTELRLQRTVSYFADFPEAWQAGEYFYDAHGRLERFEHTSTYTGEPLTTIRKEYLYMEDGRALGHDSFVNLDGTWYLSRTVRYGYNDESPLPVEVQTADTDEYTGQVYTETWGVGYDRHGRPEEIRRGPTIETFTYDRNGNAIRVRRDDIRYGVFEDRLTYSDAWNPWAGFPPLHGAFSAILFPGEYSLHLAESVESGLAGEPPATRATATVATNSHGYPTRWEISFWNTSEPDYRSTAITEFEYDES